MLDVMLRLRPVLIHLALAALIMRALIPAGWMPNPQGVGESAFVICTMDGPVVGTDGKALPGKDDPGPMILSLCRRRVPGAADGFRGPGRSRTFPQRRAAHPCGGARSPRGVVFQARFARPAVPDLN